MAGSPRYFSSLSATQLSTLQQWAAGNFVPDYNPAAPVIRSLRALPVAKRPDMLTKAAMEFCLADAFHPGCEMTWPMRFKSMYSEPFRILHADARLNPEPDYGAALTMDTLDDAQLMGPQYPGGLTRWLAVPWQADTASCESGFGGYDPSLPAFWPAHVPNQVLIADNYAIVMNSSLSDDERLAAFAHRDRWMRPIEGGTGNSKMNEMVTQFGEMGIIEQRPGPPDLPLPEFMEVESDPTSAHAVLTRASKASGSPGATSGPFRVCTKITTALKEPIGFSYDSTDRDFDRWRRAGRGRGGAESCSLPQCPAGRQPGRSPLPRPTR